ncbi:MAG: hypothetical protein FWF18_02115 [Dehalococcoidia bacterium]|nr:hypothetical protein [Dehalococcoidia bacterium]
MKAYGEPVVVDKLPRLNEYGADDLFICCSSFEDRSVSGALCFASGFRVRYSIVFVIEDPFYGKEVDANLSKLQAHLTRHTAEGVYIIRCQRDNPAEAINQLKNIWTRCKPKDADEPFITIDISGFTKIYLLQLLYFIVAEQNMGIPRIIHTTQSYTTTKLTRGVEQITTVSNFFGTISMEKQTLLVLLLGFEPDRSLSVWKHFNPARTIALISNPPRDGQMDYLEYARKNNALLLQQEGVEVRDVPPDDPYGVRNALESIYHEVRDTFNVVIGPFGTKPQTVGVFLFCLEHPKVQVVYSYPTSYTSSYLQRQPGVTLQLPMSPAVGVDIRRLAARRAVEEE